MNDLASPSFLGYSVGKELTDIRRNAVKSAPTANPIAFSYLRFSSPAQAEGDSVRRQTALRDAWLKRNSAVKLDTSLTLIDAGVERVHRIPSHEQEARTGDVP